MSAADTAFVRRLARLLAAKAVLRSMPEVLKYSRTLAAALKAVERGQGRTAANIPHYWAIYVHDGRGSITMPAGAYMVWFKNPADDPRLAGGYPVNPEETKSLRVLSKAEFKRLRPLLVFAHRVGPVAAARFFDNDGGMAGFGIDASAAAAEEFRKHVRARLGDAFSGKGVITVPL